MTEQERSGGRKVPEHRRQRGSNGFAERVAVVVESVPS